jgi:RHS repeat-associated protein
MHTASHRLRSVGARRICVALVSLAAFLVLSTRSAAQEVIEYYGQDAIGSIRVVFDATGAVIGRHDFTPFGEQIGDASPIPKERYAGLFRDGEAALDYAEARSYQARTGRFNAPDRIYSALFAPQAWNRYAYARNSPLAFVDATGEEDQTVNCELGAYWCPGTIHTGAPNDSDKYFNPDMYGYHGGEEAARAEAAFAVWIAAKFQEFRDLQSTQVTVKINGVSVDTAGCLNRVPCKPGERVEVMQAGVPDVRAVLAQVAAVAWTQVPNLLQEARILGTRVHTEFRDLIDVYLPGIETEVSYLGTKIVDWGTKGSVRLDAVLYEGQEIRAIFDLKTGNAGMSLQRMEQIYSQIPAGPRPPIIIIRPF